MLQTTPLQDFGDSLVDGDGVPQQINPKTEHLSYYTLHPHYFSDVVARCELTAMPQSYKHRGSRRSLHFKINRTGFSWPGPDTSGSVHHPG